MSEISELSRRFNIPDSFESDYEPYRMPTVYGRTLIISDLHIPYHNYIGVLRMIEYAQKLNIDSVLINGDFMDFHQMSHFLRDPRKRSVKQEIEAGNKMLDSLQAGLGVKIVYKLGNHCHDDKTEILTRDGWKLGINIDKSDELATYNINDEVVEYQQPSEIINMDYNGVMYYAQTDVFDFMVTNGHRLLYRPQYKSDKKIEYRLERVDEINFTGGKRIAMINSGKNKKPDYNISDNAIKLIAWIITDGHINKREGHKNSYIIYQSKLLNIGIICKILDDLNINYSISTRNRDIKMICGIKIKKTLPQTSIRLLRNDLDIKCGTGYKDKLFLDDLICDKYVLPEFIYNLSQRQFNIFLNELILGDGSKRKDNGYNNTCSVLYGRKDILDQIQSVCLQNGYRVSQYIYRGNQYRLNITPTYESYIDKSGEVIKQKQYNGRVWCAVVKNSTLVTRRNGKVFFSGNCERYEKWLMSKAPELLDLPAFSYQNNFSLLVRGVELVDEQRLVYLGKLPVVHGHEVGLKSAIVNPARSLYLKTFHSAICSHLHVSSQHSEKRIDGHVVTTVSTGHLGEEHPPYARNNRWNLGFAFVEYDKEYFEISNFKIVEGKVYRS